MQIGFETDSMLTGSDRNAFWFVNSPAGEEKAAKGGEEEAGLEAGVDEVDGLELVLDLGGDRVVDGPEGREPGEVVAPLDFAVHVHHAERLLAQPRIDLLLQVLVQYLGAQESS